MLEGISRFCSRFPWLVFIFVAALTALMAQQIRDKAYFEADIVKFLPTDMPAVKSDDYSKKNFNTQDTILIGIESEIGSILDPEVLRAMEKIVLELKDLKAPKTFKSILKGQTLTLNQSVGIDSDSIDSIANLEDAILDKASGSVISGSVIEKLKKDFHIVSPPGEEERLPVNDTDLLQIIPGLKDRVMGDRTFRGSILSEDLKAATIRASVVRKEVYKRRYAILELSTAIDSQSLTARFKGRDSTFPFEIYGKTINGEEINASYIEHHASVVKQHLKSYLVKTLKPVFEDEPGLKELIDQELTAQAFRSVMQYIERNDFFLNQKIGTWRSFNDGIYEFMLAEIDPFSRENLEFQIHNVKDVVDMAEIYYLTKELLEKHNPQGIKSYVAGTPIVIGVFSQMMTEDMRMLIPIAIGVIIIILILSFRSLMGVVIPLITVVLAVIWTLGIMSYLKIPFTVATSGLPIVILAVGTAYGIHLLNRYYEDARVIKNKFNLVQSSVKHVGGAIFMAAVTTVAGFSSLATTSLTTIQDFGQFSAVGVIIALVLSLTLTPAMLVLWKIPKTERYETSKTGSKHSSVTNLLLKWSQVVTLHPYRVLLVFLATIAASLFLLRNNYFEGSMLSNFKKDNVIYQSDRFLNKNLTGTTDVNLIFSFRDHINLENNQVQKSLQDKIALFNTAARQLPLEGDAAANAIINQINDSLQKEANSLPGSQEAIFDQLALVEDILNEEYRVSSNDIKVNSLDQSGEAGTEQSLDALLELEESDSTASETELDEGLLDSMAESTDEGLESLGDLTDTDVSPGSIQHPVAALSEEQQAGIKDIHRRLRLEEDNWLSTASAVMNVRLLKQKPQGIQLVKAFNQLNDFLAVDIKQPIVLHKLEQLYEFMKAMETPKVIIDDKTYKPSGFIITPVDYVRKFYKVFYHDDNPEYDRLPDVEKDGFEDQTLTDRSIIGVVLNQALSADRDGFEAVVSPDLKEFQVKIMIRGGSSIILDEYVNQAMEQVRMLFPEDDPYIAAIRTGGGSFTTMQIATLIGSSQMKSIVLSFLFVFMVTFFIFRSLGGGLFSLIPLLFTVILSFGLLAILGGQITMSTMLVASVAIGTGVDYTIHFLERLKIQLRQGDNLEQAYKTTIMTSGKAVLVNATAVAAGFLVFLFSSFNSQIMLGTLVASTMLFSCLGALTLLPAVILKTKPAFLTKLIANTGPKN